MIEADTEKKKKSSNLNEIIIFGHINISQHNKGNIVQIQSIRVEPTQLQKEPHKAILNSAWRGSRMIARSKKKKL